MADESGAVFQHGVASGDPLTDRVMLWTRVTGGTDAPVPVEWAVSRDPELDDLVASGQVEANANGDWTVHVDADGLEPETHYYYQFTALGSSSPIARTRTLPDTTDHVRFAMVSCAKFNAGFFNAYARIAARHDLNFLLHLGDYIYEASNTPPKTQTPGADIGRPFEPLTECVTLDDYRTRYSQYHRDPDVQLLHLSHAIIPTLDDHEFADGAWRQGATEHKPEYGTWADRKANAFRAREEWLPVRRPDPADPSRVWRSVALGALADVFLIDARTRRDEPVGGEGMNDPTRTALGPEQRGWLLDSLDRSKASWRILANPSVMGRTWSADLPEEVRPGLTKVKLLNDDGQGPDFDQWDGYPAERELLLDHIADNGMDNVVVLSGDVHVSLVLELHHNKDEPVAPEFVTPSLTSQNLDDKMKWPRHSGDSEAIAVRAQELLPDWQWADLDSHGYVVVDVVPDQIRVEFWHLDTVLERTPNEELASSWVVERGSGRAARVS
ncbi:MAG: alkaline phosphatase D family protein [Acidimicrobiia bacterium]